MSEPTVSVVIPSYNEEHYIDKTLENLIDQYDNDHYEIIVVDGRSTDRTRQKIEAFAVGHPGVQVSVVDNPARNIPTALNLGVQNAKGSIIARMDAHAAPPKNYVRRCVEVLDQDGVGAVGMPCLVKPGANTMLAQAIASAVSHPFGIGDAKYRLTTNDRGQEAVDTVAFACFTKELWQSLGGFNEALLANEDYDFNYRIRQQGLKVILDRSDHSEYFARTTIKELMRQYNRYGHWKAQMVKLNPYSLKLRHVIAPLFVLSVPFLGVLGFLTPVVWMVLAVELLLYTAAAFYFGLKISSANEGGFQTVLLMPLVFLTIHLSWGSAFLIGLLWNKRY